MAADATSHVPVLLDEVVNHLVHTKSGTYIDATFGRGGHSEAMLAALGPSGRVYALDRDPEAVAHGQQLAEKDARFCVAHGRFSAMAEFTTQWQLSCVDGVLMDLGVSSPQLDAAARGFSFRESGPLDMRMNPKDSSSAADWLNSASEQNIAEVLRAYGEERFAHKIARAIVTARPLNTTQELAQIVEDAIPARFQARGKHPATQTFQAVRMQINEEMDELGDGLQAAFAALCPRGRLAVISFHSLEDREVKQTFRGWTQPPQLPRRLPVMAASQIAVAESVAGPIKAGPAETQSNPRARSATLRVIAKQATKVHSGG